MSRSIRRHHEARLKNNRKLYYGNGRITDWVERDNHGGEIYHFQERMVMTQSALGRVLSTPKPCSCHMCGNPRKYFKDVTRQELIHRILESEYLNS